MCVAMAGKLTKVKLTDTVKGQVYANSAEVEALARTPASRAQVRARPRASGGENRRAGGDGLARPASVRERRAENAWA